jgi:threonyl-tRNA synthetase
MLNFKKQLAEQLSLIVLSILPGAKLIQFEMTDDGLYCDFDLKHPLNPESFSTIFEAIKIQKLNCFYELDRFSGVYENGDAKSKMLQRIYITAFDTKDQFDAYKNLVNEAALCDHKALGSQLKLFSSSNDIGQGLILWHPKGAMLRLLLESFGQSAHILNDYQWVYTPHIGRAELWKTSGHLDFYKDSMYSPIVIDDEEYYLKPMNCPFHINIYNSETRSYRDLPIRLAEYGTVYRYELSGALSGLTRVRGFTQDDAHIICTDKQIENEVANALKFSLYILRSFGFENFEAYISTKPKTKSIGDDKQWNMATDVLKKAVAFVGLKYKIDEGGGAFYGPKIDLKLKDSLNREWQCSTIQFDFNLPTRFEMNYIGNDGKKHTPFMIHRALFGSLERFTALLIEHYKGEFPLWISPVQFGIVPIKPSHNEYCRELVKKLKRLGFRVQLNDDDINMRNKIKSFELEKIPLTFVVGDKEMQSNSFAVRSRKSGDLGVMNIERLCEYLKPDIELGIPKYIFD